MYHRSLFSSAATSFTASPPNMSPTFVSPLSGYEFYIRLYFTNNEPKSTCPIVTIVLKSGKEQPITKPMIRQALDLILAVRLSSFDVGTGFGFVTVKDFSANGFSVFPKDGGLNNPVVSHGLLRRITDAPGASARKLYFSLSPLFGYELSKAAAIRAYHSVASSPPRPFIPFVNPSCLLAIVHDPNIAANGYCNFQCDPGLKCSAKVDILLKLGLVTPNSGLPSMEKILADLSQLLLIREVGLEEYLTMNTFDRSQLTYRASTSLITELVASSNM